MKALYSITTLGLIMSGLLIGCGESFEATYIGNAAVTRNDCPRGSEGNYQIRVRANISGDISIRVLEMVNVKTNRSDAAGDYIVNIPVNASFSSGKNDFYADNQKFADSETDNLSAAGIMNTDRTEITGFRYFLQSSDAGGAACFVEMKADRLVKEP